MTIWYAVFDEKDGRLVSQGTVIADPLPEGLAVVEIPEQNPEGFAWNPQTRAFDVPVKPPLNVVDELEALVARIEAASTIEEAKVAAAESKGKLEDEKGVGAIDAPVDLGGIV